MIRVLEIIPCLMYGGTELWVLNICEQLDKAIFEVDLYIYNKNAINKELLDKVKQRVHNIYYGNEYSILQSNKLKNEIMGVLANNYDIVHSHVNDANAMIAKYAHQCGVKKIISHAHNGGYNYTGLRKILFRYRQHLLCKKYIDRLACSEGAGRALYNKGKYDLINNGIDVEKFLARDIDKINQLRQEFNITVGQTVIANITRFDYTKNPLFTVAVFNEYLNLNNNAILLLGGETGNLYDATVELVTSLNIQDNVRFIGVRKDIVNCLHLADCFLFPSNYEGLGIIALECQASNLPVLTATTVPRACDMGLGLVEFLSLDDSKELWAKTLDSVIKNSEDIASDKIIAAFRDKGYLLRDAIDTIVRLYTE